MKVPIFGLSPADSLQSTPVTTATCFTNFDFIALLTVKVPSIVPPSAKDITLSFLLILYFPTLVAILISPKC